MLLRLLLLAVIGSYCFSIAPAAAIEQVTVKQAGVTRILKGKVLVEAEDGGVLLLTQDGRLWPLPKEEITARSKDEEALSAAHQGQSIRSNFSRPCRRDSTFFRPSIT